MSKVVWKKTHQLNTAEKLGIAIIGIALATTLVLPGRQTAVIAEKFLSGSAGLIRSATGR